MSRLRKATFSVAKGVLLYAVALGIVAVAAISLVGCGGGGGTTALVPGGTAASAAWTQTGATYVGRAKCANCHATIDAQYQTSEKGNGVGVGHAAHHEDRCIECHSTGFNEPSGFNLTEPGKDHLRGIGCESCHGPGSNHIATKGDKAQITRTPPAKETCFACHGGRPYKTMSEPAAVVNADYPDLKNAGPKTTIRGPHHTGAAFLMGRNGYNMTAPMPGAHATLPNTCVDCHTQKDPNTNMADHANWSKPNLDTSRSACASCHGGRSEAFLQAGVTEMMIKIGGTSATDPTTFDTNGKGADGMLQKYYDAKQIGTFWVDGAQLTEAQQAIVNNYKGAMWNFKYVYGDHSLGVHNPGFTKQLLKDCETMLKL
ncbi:MAG: Cytochrome c-554 precursor [bacterium ADurb.Bin429]|nr:MAG: Cytochrome c-554 precursor [bacterium ADurb.Bin429]